MSKITIISSVTELPSTPDYADNFNAVNTAKQEPCIICGKGIDVRKADLQIAVDLTTNEMLSPAEHDRRTVAGAESDQNSLFYVGAGCARRADVKDYVIR